MTIVFVASIIRNRLCMIYGFYYFFLCGVLLMPFAETIKEFEFSVWNYFFQKSLFAENYFLIAAMNLTTWLLLKVATSIACKICLKRYFPVLSKSCTFLSQKHMCEKCGFYFSCSRKCTFKLTTINQNNGYLL